MTKSTTLAEMMASFNEGLSYPKYKERTPVSKKAIHNAKIRELRENDFIPQENGLYKKKMSKQLRDYKMEGFYQLRKIEITENGSMLPNKYLMWDIYEELDY